MWSRCRRRRWPRLLSRGDVVVLGCSAGGRVPGGAYRQRTVAAGLGRVEARLEELAGRGDVIAYCRGPYCVYADDAVRILRARGVDARRLDVGFPEWRRAGHPVARRWRCVMLLRPFLYDASSCASYLFGCTTSGTLAVVDPHVGSRRPLPGGRRRGRDIRSWPCSRPMCRLTTCRASPSLSSERGAAAYLPADAGVESLIRRLAMVIWSSSEIPRVRALGDAGTRPRSPRVSRV